MNKLGFYGWIREGVRRAVLLGLSDAIEQIGAPTDKEDISPHLLAVLRQEKPLLTDAPRGTAPGVAGLEHAKERPERKRLGKSFSELAQAPAAAPAQ